MLRARGVSMATFAQLMIGRVDAMVSDQTGLSGIFDIDLKWNPEFERRPDGAASSSDAPTIFAALQEQLGLKLEAQRVPTQVLVIESISRPTEN